MAALLYKLIGRRVLLGFGLLLGLVLVLAAVANWRIYTTLKTSESIRTDISRVNTDLSNIRAGVGNLRRFEKDMFINLHQPQIYSEYRNRWGTIYEEVAHNLADLESISTNRTVLREFLPSFQQSLTRYRMGLFGVLEQIDQGSMQTTQAANLQLLPNKKYIRQIDISINEISAYLSVLEEQTAKHLVDQRNQSILLISLLFLVVLVIGLYIAYKVYKSTSKIAAELNYRATHDPLTQLLNRVGFKREISQQFSQRPEEQIPALLYLDLDQFKVINDVCGHMAGDKMLEQLCRTIRENVPENTISARMGGDEFAFYTTASDVSALKSTANRLLRAISHFRFVWEGRIFTVNGSIGIKCLTDEYFDFENALNLADAACFIAKDQGRNQVYCLEGEDKQVSSIKDQMDWAAKITQLIEQEKLTLFYQEIPSLKETNKTHCEVLLRTVDAEGNYVLPPNLIPAAERFSMMQQIDRWVVTASLANIAAGKTLSRFNVVSINLSGDSLSDKQFTTFILNQLKYHNIDGSRLCFEVTETAAIVNFEQAQSLITHLRNYGCQFALDDFGTGASSFGYIKKLPVDYLKIDGMFIRNLIQDPVDVTLVTSLIAIAHSLNIKTVAECVENSATAELLTNMGIDYAQGWHYHRPESANAHHLVYK